MESIPKRAIQIFVKRLTIGLRRPTRTPLEFRQRLAVNSQWNEYIGTLDAILRPSELHRSTFPSNNFDVADRVDSFAGMLLALQDDFLAVNDPLDHTNDTNHLESVVRGSHGLTHKRV
jgi:hypothetical protein